jgi:regulator of replication initiation timing
MSLLDRVNILEQQYKAFWDALITLKFDIKTLEDENRRLCGQLSALSELDPGQISANAQNIRGTAQDNLRRLHEEGFHVCHLYFGQNRRGECIFCFACLKDEG